MKKTLNATKSVLILGALLILGWSATAGMAQADFQQQVFCEAVGHSCHVVIGGQVYHLEKQPDDY